MDLHFPLYTGARFLWHGPDGALCMGVGTTLDISRQGVRIEAQSVPSPGTEVQVIVDFPSVNGGHTPGRLMGKGVAVRADIANGKPSAFEAAVRFHLAGANQPPAQKAAATNVRRLYIAARADQ